MSARIVLADDSITIQKVIGLTFASEDFALQSFDNGTEALEAIKASLPDLVIADTDMPGLNGFELCTEVKRLSPGTPVILLHTTYDAFDTARAQSVGADYASPKPFDSAELLGHIRRLLQAASASPAAAVEEFAEVEPIEELEEWGHAEPVEEVASPKASPAAAPTFAAIEDDSGLLSSDAFGELGEGDLVTADSLDETLPTELPADVVEETAEELHEHMAEIEEHRDEEPVAPTATITLPTSTKGGALWDLAGFEPYATVELSAVATTADAPQPIPEPLAETLPESLPEPLDEPAEELVHEDTPFESMHAIEAEAATIEAELEPVESLDMDDLEAEAPMGGSDPAPGGPDFAYIPDETSVKSDLTPEPAQDLGGPDFAYIPDETVPARAEADSFTSIADSMYDMTGVDAVMNPAAPLSNVSSEPTVTAEPSAPVVDASTASMLDEFEAFAAAADEPSVGTQNSTAEEHESGADPFTAFASYAQESRPADIEAADSGASDPFAAFAGADAQPTEQPVAAEEIPAPVPSALQAEPEDRLAATPVAPAVADVTPTAPSLAIPTDAQVQAAVAAQVRSLVEEQMASQIRQVVAEAVENALEEILAKLRERLRLP